MRAELTSTGVVLSLTSQEAAHLEEELLWIRDGYPWSIKVWEVLNGLHQGEHVDGSDAEAAR